MAAPTFVAEYESAWNSSTSPKTASVTVAVDDVLVIIGVAEVSTTINTPTGGTGLTYTLQQSVQVTDYCAMFVWTAVAGSAQTLTLSVGSGGGVFFGFNALRFSGSAGVGASNKTNVSSGAPSLALTTTAANSTIVTVNGDWNAVDGTSRTWRTVNSVTPSSGAGTEPTYFRDGAHYTVYGAYYTDAGVAGSKTVGLSAPSAQKYAIIAVEVKGSASGSQTNLSVSGSITPAGVLTRQPGKRPAGTITPAGALQAVRAVVRAFAGSITPAATLLRQTNKRPAGAVTPTGALARQPGKYVAGTVTPAASLVRATGKQTAGAIAPAGTVATARAILQALAGTVVPTGALIRSTARAVTGAVTPTGALNRRTTRAMAGSVTPAGTVISIRTRLLTLLGALTPSGALLRRPGKALAGSTALAGVATKQTSRLLVGGIFPAGGLSAALARMLSLAGSLTPAGVATRNVAKALVGFAASTSSVGKLIARTLDGAVTPAGAALKLLSRLLGGEMTPAATLATELNPAPPPGEPPAGRGHVALRAAGRVNVVDSPGVTLR